MHKTEEKVTKLCELKDRLVTCACSSLDDADVATNGQIIDMIKDLCEAEKDLWKACYYHKIVEAMEEEKDGSDERYGYDPWRYSSGRYAPKGHGHRSGYVDPRMWESQPGMPDGPYSGMDGMDRGVYGKYRDAKRHYTETGKPSDRDEMSHHAKMYMAEAVGTMRDIWKDADPEMKTKMKADLAALSKEFGIA